MFEPTVLGHNYDAAYHSIKEQLNDLRRQTAAVLLAEFPDRDILVKHAESLRESLGSDGVEVNVLMKGRQFTIISMPSGTTVETSYPDESSLCALSVGADMPLAIRNGHKSSITAGHPMLSTWSAWAAAPVHIQGYAAGTVCALEGEPRDWNQDDERELQRIAEIISSTVEDWAEKPLD